MPKTLSELALRFGGALLSVILVTTIRLALDPLLGDRFFFSTFFAAIVLTAWFGGVGPSLLALVLSWLSVDYFFLQPQGPRPIYGLKTPVAFPFFVVGLTTILVSGFMRAAQRRARENLLEARRAFEDQRAQREWLRITLASIADAVITTDAEGRVTSLNPVAERITGWRASEAAGRPLREIFRTVEETTHRSTALPVAQVVQGGGVVLSDDHLVLMARDGEARCVEHNTAPIKDDRGQVTGIVIVFRDITGRRRAEAALRESEERFRQLAEHITDVFWIFNPSEQQTEYVSPAYEAIWGRSCESLYERSLSYLEAVHPEDRGRATLAHARLVAGETTADEYRVERPDGMIRWVWNRGFPIRDDSGRVVRLTGIAEDITERKRAEAELREQAERLRLALDASRMGTWEWDIRTGEVAWSDNLEEIHGLPRGGFDGTFEGFQRLIHPEDRGLMERAIARSIVQGADFEVEFRNLWPDGSIHWMTGRGKVFTDELGVPTRMLGVGMDITERMRSEEALRQSEQRFARFMQHLPGLAWIKDLQGRYVYANDAAEKAFRTPRAELYGKTDDEVFPPETAAQFKEHDRQALASGTGLQVIETLEHEDGVLHHSLVTKFPIFGPDGEAALVGGMAIDITERKRAEAALRESEKRFRTLADATPVLIWGSDAGTRCTYFNKQWLDFTGRTAEQEAGWGWTEGVHPDDLERCWETYASAFDARRPFTMEYRLRRHDGEYRWVLDTGVPRFAPDGTFSGYIGSGIDITDRKRAEEELREADRRKEEFLAVLSHEIRNPLAPIQTALDVMQREALTGAELERERGVMERQVRHLTRLVDDLLDVSRISRGRIVLHKEVVELAAAEVGQGLVTIEQQICRTELGVDHVVPHPKDTTVGSGGSTSASRQTYVTGGAVKAACELVRARVLGLAQRRLGRTVAGLRLAGGHVVSDAEGTLGSIAEIVGDEILEETVEWRHRPTYPVDPETGQGFAHVQYAFAAHRAVVDVDTDLGLVKVIELACTQDVGKAMNPQAVEGQIQGGSAQGLGLAIMEEIQVRDGRIANPSFTDYLIPTILDMPPMQIEVLEYPDPNAPYGLRGVGEPPTISSGPAIAAAIRAATGLDLSRIPVRPEHITGTA